MNSEAKNVTRADLAEAVARTSGLPRREAAGMVAMALDLIADRLLRGEAVMISGFGKFTVVHRTARMARNVRLGGDVLIPPRRAIVFRPAPGFVALLNGDVGGRRVTRKKQEPAQALRVPDASLPSLAR